MSDLVISGLVRRRAALAGEIEADHEAIRKMVLDLESLGATIRQFDPDYRVEAIKLKGFRPPSDWSNRGQMSGIILSALRQAAEPLTTRNIALQLLIERALDKSDQRALAAHDNAGRCSAPEPARKRPCSVRSGARAVHALGNRKIILASGFFCDTRFCSQKRFTVC